MSTKTVLLKSFVSTLPIQNFFNNEIFLICGSYANDNVHRSLNLFAFDLNFGSYSSTEAKFTNSELSRPIDQVSLYSLYTLAS